VAARLRLSAGASFAPARFDLTAARRLSDLDAEEIVGSARIIDGAPVREVRFDSTMWSPRGEPHPIRIQAFVALPPGPIEPHSKPAVVHAHGLGAAGDPEQAANLARNLDVVALSISAPGLGGSEGQGPTAEDPRPIFETIPDVRGSWLYAYTHAILRAITYLQSRPEVDPQAIVVTGASMGGLASFIAGGVDDRIRGVLPVSASGGLARAAAENTWFRRLVLSAGGLKPEDPAARAFFRGLDPLAFAGRQKGAVYLLTGAQDEFFPLDQVVATWRALHAPAKSLAVVADYDHGWYFGFGCPARCMPGAPSSSATAPATETPAGSGAAPPPPCPRAPTCPAACADGAAPPYCGPEASYNRLDDFNARWALLLRALVAQHAARPRRPFGPPPPAPFVARRRDQVVVRPVSLLALRAVRVAVSEDGGLTYGQFPLERAPDGAYHLHRRVSDHAILLAELEAEDGTVASSVPILPRGFRPHVRPFGPHP